jgi:CheY-like chemotaxis protein
MLPLEIYCLFGKFELTDVTDELRNPLHAILNVSTFLREHPQLKPEQLQLCDAICASSYYMSDLINDVLDTAKFEAGKVSLEVLPVNFNDMVQQLVLPIRENLKTKSIGFKVDIDNQIPELLDLDPTRFKQVLSNLLSNAVKFTPKNGEITFHARCEPRKEHHQVHCASHLYWLIIEIEDSGIGISPENVEKLFKPYEQATISTSREYGGTGLGLAICKQIIDLMNGTVCVESEIGKGSKFIVKVPVSVPDTSNISDSLTTVNTAKHIGGDMNVRLGYEVFGRSVSALQQQQSNTKANENEGLCGDDGQGDMSIRVDRFESRSYSSLVHAQANVTPSVDGNNETYACKPNSLNNTEPISPTAEFRQQQNLGQQQEQSETSIDIANIPSDRDLKPPFAFTQSPSIDNMPDPSLNTSSSDTTKLSITMIHHHPYQYLEAEMRSKQPQQRKLSNLSGTPSTEDTTSNTNPNSVMSAYFSRLRVLIVDDSAINRKILNKILKGLGVGTVDECTNGQECLDLVFDQQQQENGTHHQPLLEQSSHPNQREKIDASTANNNLSSFSSNPPRYHIIFMDVQMPIMDGIEATQRLRKSGVTCPIIAVTGNHIKSKEEFLNHGFTSLAPKPFLKPDALRMLKEFGGAP